MRFNVASDFLSSGNSSVSLYAARTRQDSSNLSDVLFNLAKLSLYMKIAVPEINSVTIPAMTPNPLTSSLFTVLQPNEGAKRLAIIMTISY